MPIFRHKTLKRSFRWRLHAILFLYGVAIAWLALRSG